jgi:hypothetical protein
MTQARKLKKQIRARARKTGERYTAARRQVLRQKGHPERVATRSTSAPAPRAATPVPPALEKREAGLTQKTGHGWAHWFAVLDAFDAAAKGHTASAHHVAVDHGVEGWYAQEITVAYERARGLRGVNQRLSGAFEVSVSKSLPVPVKEVVKALRDPRRRRRFFADLDPDIRGAFEAALDGPKGLREREQGGARMRFQTKSGITVVLYLDPKTNGRSGFVATNLKLKGKDDVARIREAWRPALEALRAHLAD